MVAAGFAVSTHLVVFPHAAPPVQTKGKCPCSALVRSLHLFRQPRVTNVYTWSLSCADCHFYCVSTYHNVTGLRLAKDTKTVLRAVELNLLVDLDLSQKAALPLRIQQTFTDGHCGCCTTTTQHLQHFFLSLLLFFNSQCHFLLQQGNLLL